jgi:hypothetical protein
MRARGYSAQIGVPLRARTGRMVLVTVLLTVAAAGCGSAGKQVGNNSTQAKLTACGTAKTAANVPIHVEVTQGDVSCGTALLIERKYAAAIRSGQAPGNGGGGPVKINGWTCQGYATPIVLHTGKASRCTNGGNQILAILPTTA